MMTKRSNTIALVDFPRLSPREKEKKTLKQRIINGQLITFDLLQNDLFFWREIEWLAVQHLYFILGYSSRCT